MNEHTAALLHNLATKLGTTSEYLWSVLLKQAPVQSSIILGQYAMTVLLLVLIWRFRAQLGSVVEKLIESEGTAILSFIGAVILAILACVWLVACILSFEPMVTGFLNPEYWALKEVLGAVKK